MTDRKILKRLFLEHYSGMICLARTLLYAEEEAEDVVQDVFLHLSKADILPPNDKAQAYLLAAVRNGCISRIRQRSLAEQVKGLYTLEAEADQQFSEARMHALEAVCECAEAHLEEPYLSIFRLRFEQGLTLKEIARQLDMNLKTVYKYLAQSVQRVQQYYRH